MHSILDDMYLNVPTQEDEMIEESKALDNTNMEDLKNTTSDVKVHGNPGMWVCVCKASSESQGWMKSTKVMELDPDNCLGCLVQVTTEIRGQVAEALTFVPKATLYDFGIGD